MLRFKAGTITAALSALLAFGPCSAEAAETPGLGKTGKPDLKSVGPLTFGPAGVLFVGDPQGAAVFAIGVNPAPATPAAAEIKLEGIDGGEISRRMSPKQATVLDLFHELIYFTSVFPHPRLTIEVPLVTVEERRIPGHGKRRRWRRNDHVTYDLSMVDVVSTHIFQTNNDLLALLPNELPQTFHTGDLATAMKIQRWVAQRITYCLRKTGGMNLVGKQGNALTYEVVREVVARKPRKPSKPRKSAS